MGLDTEILRREDIDRQAEENLMQLLKRNMLRNGEEVSEEALIRKGFSADYARRIVALEPSETLELFLADL